MNSSNNTTENEQSLNRIIEIPVQHLTSPLKQHQQHQREQSPRSQQFAHNRPSATFEDFPNHNNNNINTTNLFSRPRLLQPTSDEFFHSFDQDPFFSDFPTHPFNKLTAHQHKSPNHSPYFDRKPQQQQQQPLQSTSLPFTYQSTAETQQDTLAPKQPQRQEIPVTIQKSTQELQQQHLSESPKVKTEIKIDTSERTTPAVVDSLAESFQNFKKQQQQQQQQTHRSESPAKTQQKPLERTKQQEENKPRSPSPKTNMGNLPSFGHQQTNTKQSQPQAQKTTQAFTAAAAAEAANFNSPPHQASSQQQRGPKTSQEKLDEIALRLNELDRKVSEFTGKCRDKEFLKLDEFLTKCLLELDAIERGDERINQLRKSLIKNTHAISDKLEAKCEENDAKLKQQQQQQQQDGVPVECTNRGITHESQQVTSNEPTS